jgi:hypothetical protein
MNSVQTHIAPSYKKIKEYERRGWKIFNKNKNMHDLAVVMENEQFKQFFDEHFKTWDDVKTIIMFMKVYQLIDNTYPLFTPQQKICILHDIIENKDSRHTISTYMQNWIDSSNIPRSIQVVN